MNDMITVRGFVATEVTNRQTQNGDAQTSFRLVCTDRIFNRDTGQYQDGHSNWFGVTCYRHLAANATFSIKQGDRVIVYGRLKLRQWTNSEGRSGTSADIEAEAIGHDMRFGVGTLKRSNGTHRTGDFSDAAAGDDSKADDGGNGPVGESRYDDAEGSESEDSTTSDALRNVNLETGEVLDEVDSEAESEKVAF